jgi:Tol biopolymer transport system component
MVVIKKYIFILFLFSGFFSYAQFYNGLQQDYGKNRIQFKYFDWKYYAFERCQVYFYDGGKDLAQYVAYRAQRQLEQMEKKMDYQLEDQIQILVYTKQTDFAGANAGLKSEESANAGGTTKIRGSTINVYFNGNHFELEKQIKSGIAEIIMNQIFYDGNAAEVARNSALLVVPDWFKQGVLSYYAEPWSVDADNIAGDIIKQDKLVSFNRLSGKESKYAGYALINYIAETYGENILPNILYMVRVTRSVESAFTFVLGLTTEDLINEMIMAYAKNAMDFDSKRYLPDMKDKIVKRPKITKKYFQVKLNYDATKLAYVTNEMGQTKVYLKDLETNKTKRIFKRGHKLDRIIDLSYPLIAWHPKANILGYITEEDEKIVFNTLDIDSKEKFSRNMTGFEKITSIEYAPDGKRLVITGYKKAKGQSDVFVFTMNSSGIENITNDIFDDKDAVFINKGKQIAFSSNRSDVDSAKINTWDGKYDIDLSNNYDIYVYDEETKNQKLYRVTNTNAWNEFLPKDFGNKKLSFISEQNGMRNLFVSQMDSVITSVDTSTHYALQFTSLPQTNFRRSIEEYDLNLSTRKKAYSIIFDSREQIFIEDLKLKLDSTVQLDNTAFRMKANYIANAAPVSTVAQPITNTNVRIIYADSSNTTNNNGIDLKDYKIGQNNSLKTEVDTANNEVTKAVLKRKFLFPVVQNYYLNFAQDQAVTQIDNTFLGQTYQVYGPRPLNNSSRLNPVLKFGFSDQFEDYRLVLGMRIDFRDLKNNEYLISWEDRSKRWDKQLVLHRQGQPLYIQIKEGYETPTKILTHDVRYILKYPFNEVSALRLTPTYRIDRSVFQNYNSEIAKFKNEYKNWVGGKVEYIFDNALEKGVNLRTGLKAKFFGEYYQLIDKKSDKNLIAFGFDVRHYLKIHRDFIWANRLAYGGSIGTNRIAYFLGGVDNWFAPRFNDKIQVKREDTYEYQALAVNMRGFRQNIRNGNNFAVLNSELRFPIFKYLFNRPLKSDLFNTFQIIGFGDLGMAWVGKNPFSDENVNNELYFFDVISNPPPIVTKVVEKINPLVAGYGYGFRARIFGYFIRYDFSYGIEDLKVQPVCRYLSLGFDF